MGGSSGKLAKVLSGNASKDFLVSTFKSLDKDKSNTLTHDELMNLVDSSFAYFSKDESLASTHVPTSDPPVTFSQWPTLTQPQRTKINDAVARVLISAIDYPRKKFVVMADFIKFDWTHFLSTVETTIKKDADNEKKERERQEAAKKKAEEDKKAAEKKAAEDIAAFEAMLPTLESPSTFLDFIKNDRDYYFYITKQISWPTGITLDHLNGDQLWILELDDKRLQDIPQKMVWPLRLYRSEDLQDNEVTYTANLYGDLRKFHGDFTRNMTYQCQQIEGFPSSLPFTLTPKCRVNSHSFVIYFCKDNPAALNDHIHLVLAGKLYIKK